MRKPAALRTSRLPASDSQKNSLQRPRARRALAPVRGAVCELRPANFAPGPAIRPSLKIGLAIAPVAGGLTRKAPAFDRLPARKRATGGMRLLVREPSAQWSAEN